MARTKLELNESVLATFKDGTVVIYNSIEEASEHTGLSVNQIKSRCGKPGSGSKSKDGVTFIWADEHTRKSKQAKRNKSKGNGFELEIINKLKAIGFSGCVSARSQNKLADANKIDIVDMNNELPVNIQSKYTSNTPNYFGIRDACTDKSKPFCVIWKKSINGDSSPGTIAMVDVEFFYSLLKIYYNNLNRK